MIVVYEVALSVLRLVRHYACHLEEREWEMVHHILQAAQHHLTQQVSEGELGGRLGSRGAGGREERGGGGGGGGAGS